MKGSMQRRKTSEHKAMTKPIAAFLLCMALTLQSIAHYDFNQNCISAYSEIVALNFDGGKKWIEKEKSVQPENRIVVLLENYIDFMTLTIGEKPSDFESLKPNRSTRVDLLQKGDNKSPWYRHCLAAVHLQWSFARVKFGEYMMAALDLNRAYRLIEENRKEHPGFVPDLLLSGVMNAMIGSIPENYQWATRLVGMEGAIETGRAQLYELLDIARKHSRWNYMVPEAYFYLAFIEMNLQSDKALVVQLLDSLNTESYNSPLMCYIRANLSIRAWKNDEAIKLLAGCRIPGNSYPFYYLDYLQGIARLNRLDKDAARHFLNFVNRYEGLNYIKSAYQRLAWISLINGDQNGYRFYMNRVLSSGQAFVDEDKQAQKEASSGHIPNIRLLKARLLFDGGYFEQALNLLALEVTPEYLPALPDSVEYFYRKGRICHEWGKPKQAKDYYKQTILLGRDLPDFYAGNSALQLGMIYENERNFAQADHYYELCLKLKFTEYRTSIQQKARAGRQRIAQKK